MHRQAILLLCVGFAFFQFSCNRPTFKNAEAAGAKTNTDSKTEDLHQRLREMEARERELQRQIDEEKLNAQQSALTAEREQLNRDREALEKDRKMAEAAPEPTILESANPPVVSKLDPVTDPLPAAVPGADYQLFFDSLAGHGAWFETTEYGCVWQPSAARLDTAWRPYTSGRWIDSDQGWAWLSDEPFGWACYHYGRWALLAGRGWIWVPGEIWAPSWVAWRHCDDYIGWCPLPPETGCFDDGIFGSSTDDDYSISPECYTFVPASSFDQPVLSNRVPPAACAAFFSSTVNVTSLIVRPHRVQCHGPKIEWVNRCLKKPMPHYVLNCDPHGERRHHLDGHKVRLFTPEIRAPWNPRLRPAGLVEQLGKVEIVRAQRPAKDAQLRRFNEAVQKRRRLAEEAVRSGTGQKVMAQQHLRSEIFRQRHALGLDSAAPVNAKQGPAESTRSGKPRGNDADTQLRLAKIRQEIGQQRGNLAHPPPAGPARPPSPPTRSQETAAAAQAQQQRLVQEEEMRRQERLRAVEQQRQRLQDEADRVEQARREAMQRKALEEQKNRQMESARREKLQRDARQREAEEQRQHLLLELARRQREQTEQAQKTAEIHQRKLSDEATRLQAAQNAAREAEQHEVALQADRREQELAAKSRQLADDQHRHTKLESDRTERTRREESQRHAFELQQKRTLEAAQQERAAAAQTRRAADEQQRKMRDETARLEQQRLAAELQRKAQEESSQREVQERQREMAQHRTREENAQRERIQAQREQQAQREHAQRAAQEHQRRESEARSPRKH
ncbi:MAG: hypothetical protein KA004_02025 [Verrucomicrobiales bacterium]|nr:hypothetical protein [Verrucomicrobiales bacterium]